MSSVYISEPPTSGHVILQTNTFGMIDIHLYCNECPTTCQYFLQLCSHDYYNHMIFHRIINNLLIQTGLVRFNNNTEDQNTDVSQRQHQQQQQDTTNGMKHSEYQKLIRANESYERRQYEVHSRIRFSHRGQVAMALPVPQNTSKKSTDDDDHDEEELQPQFFITTDEAPYLNGKHVIFGTVVGPSIFNVIRMNQYVSNTIGAGVGVDIGSSSNSDTINVIDANDSSAPRIVSIKIVTNPFEHLMIPKSTIIRQNIAPWIMHLQPNDNGKTNISTMNKKKRKGKLDTNVLSFGDEVNDDDDGTIVVVSKKEATKHTTNSQQQPSSELSDIYSSIETTTDDTTTINHQRRHDLTIFSSENIPLPQQLTPNPNDNGIDNPARVNGSEKKDDIPQRDTPGLELNRDADTPSASEMLTLSKQKPTTTSAVEAHRAKYLSRKQKRDALANTGSNANNTTSTKQQRDDETYNKFINFRRKIHETVKVSSASNDTTIISHEQQQQDNSLASRMARRAQQQAEEERKKNDPDYDDDTAVPSYHGQVLLQEDDDDDPRRWLQTKFICKKHMDLLSGDNDKNRKVETDDYEVIDPKKSSKPRTEKRKER